MTIDREKLDILAVRSHRGCSESKDELARHLWPLVQRVASTFVIPGNDRTENESVGLVALSEALNEYEPDRGAVLPYVSRVVRNALIKEKEKRIKGRSEADSECVEREASPETPEKVDPSNLRRAWSYLTHAEKRGVMAVLGQSQFVEVGEKEGVTKQAVEKAWRSARTMINVVADGMPVKRALQPYSRFDIYLEELLESVG